MDLGQGSNGVRNRVAGRGRQRGGIFGAIVVLQLLVFLAVPVVAAAIEHAPRGAFGSAAQPTVSTELTFGMAVNQETGDVLVIDAEAEKLSRYHEDGTASEFSALGSNSIPIAFEFNPAEVEVAVDNSGTATDGNIYVARGVGGIKMFDKNGNSLGELTESSEGALGNCNGVTVDPLGNVYVSCAFEKIHKYDPAGAAPAKADNVANFEFSSAVGLAAGSGPTAGFLFATHFFGTTAKLDATTGVEKYDVDPGFFDTTVSVNPANGHVFIAGAEEVREYNAAGATPTELAANHLPESSFSKGVAVNGSTGNFYVTRSETTKIEVFAKSFIFGSAAQPTVSTELTFGMAVNQETGDVLVIDAEAEKLSRYHEDGTASEFSALGSNSIPIAFEFNPAEVEVAVDNSGTATDGNIYVARGVGGIKMFDKNGNSLGELTESSEGALGNCNGVTVDPLGNVYVSCAFEKIHKYDPAGAAPAKADNVANFEFSSAVGLAAGSGPTAGFLFATHFFGTTAKLDATTGVEKYDVDPGFFDTTVSVNPANGHVFIAGAEEVREYNAAGATPTELAANHLPESSFSKGVAVNGSTGNFYVTRSETTKIEVFPGEAAGRVLTVAKDGTGSGTVESVVPASPVINCGTECVQEYEDGETVVLKGTPAPHSKPVVWTGCDTVNVENECEVSMTSAKKVTATFDSIQHTFTVTKGGTGNGSFTCSEDGGAVGGCTKSFNEGHSVTVIATPAKGSVFVEFTGGTGSAAACNGIKTTECTFTIEADSTLKGNFAKETHSITITKGGSGEGSVECKVGAGPFGSCEVLVETGSQVTVKATAALHSSVAPFSGGAGSATVCNGKMIECTFPLVSDSALTANFNKITHTLSVSTAGTGSGSVTCNGGACAASYDEGTSVTFAATANSGSTFAGFSGGGCSGASCTVTMGADTAVTATFNANPTPPPPIKCKVPKVKGLTLAKAKSALTKAHCKPGKVTKPKPKKGKKLPPLVVKSSSPGQGKVLAENSKVNLKLGPKPKKH